jgi:hypothetical protein
MASFDKNPIVGDVCRWFQKKLPSLFSSAESLRKSIQIDPNKIFVQRIENNLKVTVKAMRYSKPVKGRKGITFIKATKDRVDLLLTGLTLKDQVVLDGNRALPEVTIEEALLLSYLVVSGVFNEESKRSLFLKLIQEAK